MADRRPSSETLEETEYDMRLYPAMMQAQPAWFGEIPWKRSAERQLSEDAIATLEYMDLIEGHVCAGYLHLALASPTVRATTESTDFAAGWGVQENWHGIALHRFLDQYRAFRSQPGLPCRTTAGHRSRSQDGTRTCSSVPPRPSLPSSIPRFTRASDTGTRS